MLQNYNLCVNHIESMFSVVKEYYNTSPGKRKLQMKQKDSEFIILANLDCCFQAIVFSFWHTDPAHLDIMSLGEYEY